MKLRYIGLVNNQFEYQVTINGHTFAFHTGIGWNSKKKLGESYKRLSPEESKQVLSEECRYNHILRTQNIDSMPLWRREPSESDVLECLKSDCEAGQMAFDEFCDSFGYSNDSLKALDIYRACAETAQKLRGFKFPESEE